MTNIMTSYRWSSVTDIVIDGVEDLPLQPGDQRGLAGERGEPPGDRHLAVEESPAHQSQAVPGLLQGGSAGREEPSYVCPHFVD